MWYVNLEATENGNHGNPVSNYSQGMVGLPDDLLSDYIQWKGFVNFTSIVDDIIVTLEVNQEAYDAWEEEHGENPEEVLATAKEAKIGEMSETCANTITAGVDFNGYHYSLAIEDQLNMMDLVAMIQSGQATVPYHADGEDCRFYSAEEFMQLTDLATYHKLYHESYFNSLRGYINSMETVEEVNAVEYGIEIPVEYQTEVLRELIARNS